MSNKYKELKNLLSWSKEAPELQIGFKQTVYYLIWNSFRKNEITYEEYKNLINDPFVKLQNIGLLS